ncbi:Uncharacterised protein [uncultured Clostridium sp.]|nr:Uncharacterised protein [uncultured Clostridium sp.]
MGNFFMLLIYVIFAFILGILAFVLKSMLSQFLLSPVIKNRAVCIIRYTPPGFL